MAFFSPPFANYTNSTFINTQRIYASDATMIHEMANLYERCVRAEVGLARAPADAKPQAQAQLLGARKQFTGTLSRDSKNASGALRLLTYASVAANGSNSTVEGVLLGPGMVQLYVEWLGGEMQSLDRQCLAMAGRHDEINMCGTWWCDNAPVSRGLAPLRKAAQTTPRVDPGLRIYQLIRTLVLIPAPSDGIRKKRSKEIALCVEENHQEALKIP
jgi:hypothetical protein